jgi:hypothetical protein
MATQGFTNCFALWLTAYKSLGRCLLVIGGNLDATVEFTRRTV